MKWELITAGDGARWQACLDGLPDWDVYHRPEYHRLCELDGGGEAFMFHAEDGDDRLAHCFLLKPIRRVGRHVPGVDLNDLETAYGYSGPVATTTDAAFLERAWSAFDGWCGDNRVVSEFVRFNPLLGNHVYCHPAMTVIDDRDTIVIRLDGGEDDLWNQYEPVQRNRVRKALKNGLECVPDDFRAGIGHFVDLYRSTMDRVGADDFYRFRDAYFDFLEANLMETLRLFSVMHQGRRIAAGLFFFDRGNVHYHLGGSDAEFRKLAPNNLLFHGVALWGMENGYRRFHLGGGTGNAPDDALLRFKTRFSKQRLRFRFGKRVCDAAAFESLCSEWRNQNAGAEPASPYFQLYRLPLAS